MAETHYRRANEFRVDAAHNLSDVLFLPAQRAARLDSTRFENSLEQILVQPDLPQI
jgi:hypothetical protein